MLSRTLVREITRPTLALGVAIALIALVLLPGIAAARTPEVRSGASARPTADTRPVPSPVPTPGPSTTPKGGKIQADPDGGKLRERFAKNAERAAIDLGVNGEGMTTSEVTERFNSGPFAYQWGVECLNGGTTQYATSSIGYYGATDGSTPQLNQTYYAGVMVGAGLPCGGAIASTIKIYPPKGTTIAIDAATNWRVRCFAETNTPRHEVTSDTSADCKAVPLADGSWSLGTRRLGSGWIFEIYVPVKSSQSLRGMAGANGGDWWTGHSEVWTASPSIAYPKAIAWAGGGLPDIGITYPNPAATDVTCTSATTTGYVFSQYTAGPAYIQIGTVAGTYPTAAGPVELSAANQAYTVWASGWQLQPGVTYHWRVIYQTNNQWFLGADQVFTTRTDCAGPTGSVSINGDHPYTSNTAVQLSLAATDPAGVSQMRFRNAGGTWGAWEAFAGTRAWTLPAGEGAKTVEVSYKDSLGNESATFSDSITLDQTAPTGSVAIAGGAASTASQNVTLTLSATDAAPVSRMRFSNDGTTWSAWQSYATSAAWSLTAGNGTKTVFAQFQDSASMISAAAQDTITLNVPVADTTPPTGTIVINRGAALVNTTAVQLALTATDAGSGVNGMRFSNDGVTWSAWEAMAASRAWTLTTGDGAKTVRVQYRDGAGNITAAIADSITLDRTLPVPKAPAHSILVAAVATSTAPAKATIRIAWPAATDLNGIARYELQQSVNGGAFTAVALSSPTATSINRALSMGRYRFQVRAFDRAGNASAFVAGPTFTLAGYQETATVADATGTKVAYLGTWTSAPVTGAWGGSVRHASTAGAKATLTFSGNQVAFVTTKGPDRGKLDLYLDGVKVTATPIDLYASTAQPARVVFSRAVTAGTHTLEVRVLGTRNTLSTANRVDVDGFLVAR